VPVARRQRSPRCALTDRPRAAVIARFERKGFKLVALKLVTPSKEHLEKHCRCGVAWCDVGVGVT
jgi:hypothetical protein